MKTKLALFIALSIPLAASPVFAGHGSHGSTELHTSQAPIDEQNAKENEELLKNCAQYVGRIEQRIGRLQAEIKGMRVAPSVHDELKKLEQNLKEANNIARSLQIF